MYLVLTIVGRVGLLWAQILAICILHNLKVHIKGASLRILQFIALPTNHAKQVPVDFDRL